MSENVKSKCNGSGSEFVENWKVNKCLVAVLDFACIIMLFIGKRNSGRKGTELAISCTVSCFFIMQACMMMMMILA